MNNDKKFNAADVMVIEMRSYNLPKIEPAIGSQWTLNGKANEHYKLYKDCFEHSVTNGAICKSYSKYVYGEGLYDVNGINISKYMNKKDIRQIVTDFKVYGSYAIQIIWNLGKTKPVLIKRLPIYKMGLNIDKNLEVNGYWYCYDWTKIGTYKPEFYTKFDGTYKFHMDKKGNPLKTGHDVEVLIIGNETDEWFAYPDYVQGLQYAEVEIELANSTINHIMNGFQGGSLVNFNNGAPEDPAVRDQYRKQVIENLTGSNAKNKIITSFNDGAERAMTVEIFNPANVDQQYVVFEESARQNLIVAHDAPPILFSGNRDGGGLGNNAEELKTATQSLYRKQIYPMRETIIDGLHEVFQYIDPTINLEFKDFEEFNSEESQALKPTE